MNAATQIFLAKNVLGMTDQAVASEANAPLPWNEKLKDNEDETDTTESLDESTQS